MSHIVTIQTRVQDPAAVAAACQRLGLTAPVQGTARLYSGEATGLIVQLPGWQYPAVIDTATGAVRYDNFEGRWGEPVAALRALPSLAHRDGTALLLLHNFHRFLNNPEVIQTLFSQLVAGKQQRTFVGVLAPVVQVPVELEKLFVVLEHALPDRDQLLGIARELTSDSPQDLPQGDDLQRVLDAAAGLTRYEAEGALMGSRASGARLIPIQAGSPSARLIAREHRTLGVDGPRVGRPKPRAAGADWSSVPSLLGHGSAVRLASSAAPACCCRVSSDRPPARRISSWAIVSSCPTRGPASSSWPHAA